MPSLAKVETVKLRNLAATFKIIRERGPISRTAIAKLLRLNRSTISRLVDQLMALGLVVEGAEIGPSTRRGGRRPLWRLHGPYQICASCDHRRETRLSIAT